jgi:UDP-N-acetylmuramoylalanine--D-glutamate ligase
MRIGIIGFVAEGRAAYEYWRRKGAQITILDRNPETKVPAGVAKVLGPHYLDNLDGFDLLVRSPGVKPWEIESDAPVTSVTKEFFAQCPAPIIGVTGTKGKGTASTLIARILEAAGKTVWLGGNIGRPGLEFLDRVKSTDVVVLELSSFQLMDLDVSPHVAVCLMVVPEHLDWHRDFNEYIQAKSTISRYQAAGDTMVFHAHNQYAKQIAELSAGKKMPYMESPGAQVRGDEIVISGQVICRTDEVGLIGPHNLENICAAVTATWELLGRRTDVIAGVVKAFTGLEHRLERVADIDGVQYVNDTFATNPSAAIAAIRSFDQPLVMILGGYDRSNDLTEMVKAVAEAKPRAVVAIGETGPQIERLLADLRVRPVIRGAQTMPEIVAQARAAARPGDVVLLSPGSASFGLFKNYKDRGLQFREAVRHLEATS